MLHINKTLESVRFVYRDWDGLERWIASLSSLNQEAEL